jgi:RNA polymerase sigma factor (TIGR02999 family)
MSEATRLLHAAAAGDAKAAADLLPLVYDELRRLAAWQMANESPGHTLDATALVHEAYLRLVGQDDTACWQHRRHFVAAAAEAMRRILVESARRKGRIKHGGGKLRVELDDQLGAISPVSDELLALDEALARLEAREPVRAELVKLRYFGGLSMPEAAQFLGISLATAERYWAFARVWLYSELAVQNESK